MKRFRYPETKQNKVKNKDNILKKNIHFCTLEQFHEAAELSYMFKDRTPPLLFQYIGNQKKNILISHYTKLRQKTQNNQQNTQKLTTPYA